VGGLGGPVDAGGVPGGGVHRVPVVQRLPGDDLHGGHRIARPGRRDRGAGGDDEDRGAADPARRDLRDRGAVRGDPGDLVPGVPQTGVPDGSDPPSLRAAGVERDQDHPEVLDRGLDLRGDRVHDLSAEPGGVRGSPKWETRVPFCWASRIIIPSFCKPPPSRLLSADSFAVVGRSSLLCFEPTARLP